MDAATIVILGVMGPFILLGIILLPIGLHLKKKEQEELEKEAKGTQQ
ncbi:MAG: hypothetical protein LBQ94_12720 [Treponema sp.]|jgi:hypothetical protein|nr:hypothetical protein [Treponema sp.]